jgi:hypothetical protein
MQYFVIVKQRIMNLSIQWLDIAGKKIDICMSVIDSNQSVKVIVK